MKRVVLFMMLLGCFGWLSNMEFEAEKQSADYYQQMKNSAVRIQQLKDAGINPYPW